MKLHRLIPNCLTLASTNDKVVGVLTNEGPIVHRNVGPLNLDSAEFLHKAAAGLYDLQDDASLLGWPNSFSVQIWVRSTNAAAGQSSSDVAFFSNKDWSSGSNPGWVLALGWAGDPDIRFQWNFATLAGGRDDFDPTGHNAIVFDGRWHQIVVTYIRSEDAIFYVDGALIGTADISDNASGTANAGLRLALGNDGTGAYSEGDGSTYNGDLDEAAIWLRGLTPAEVSEIYHASLAGRDLYGNARPTPPLLKIVGLLRSSGTNVLTLAWTNNGVACVLESAADLRGAWKAEPASCTTNANWISATVTNAATAHYFRLRKS